MKSRKSEISVKRDHLNKVLLSIKSNLQMGDLKKGWLREIRECLGMTYKQLAKRIGLEQSTVRRLEANEVKKTITLAALEKMANALECELVYSIVPKTSLHQILEERAEKVLKKEEELVQRTMELEAQGDDIERDVHKAYLIVDLDRRLWED